MSPARSYTAGIGWSTVTRTMRIGAGQETALVDRMLTSASAGRSSVVLIEGEPGIGKTALVDDAAERAAGWAVLRARGAPSETRLAFSGLRDLINPVAACVGRLPRAQARALRAVLALESAEVLDRFAVAAATLSLLVAVADDGPLLVIVDDLHWLDPESSEAVTFAARRLYSEAIAMMLAARPEELDHDLVARLPVHRIAGLSVADSRELLATVTGQRVSVDVAAKLRQHTGGNPLALLELARVIEPEVLSGSAPLDSIPPATVEEQYARRIALLSPRARSALLVYALLDSPRTPTVAAALALLGLDLEALDEAESAGLLRTDGALGLAFRHPLVRAATYNSASLAERRAGHRAIAAVLIGEGDEDERALHLAAGATRPDEELATTLVNAADSARRRGGFAASARILQMSADLSPDQESKAQRLLQAGRDAGLAGHEKWARMLLEQAFSLSETPHLRADIQNARGHVRAMHDPPLEAHSALVDAAARIEEFDPARAGEMYLTAAWACLNKGRVQLGIAAGRRALELLADAGSPLAPPARAIIAGFEICTGDPAGTVELIDASDALRREPLPGIAGIEWDSRTAHPLIWIEEYARAAFLLERSITTAREQSAIAALPFALARRAELAFHTGAWENAHADAAEAVQLAEETRQHVVGYCEVTLALIEAGRGRAESCRTHAANGRAAATAFVAGSVDAYARAAEGLLALGLKEEEGAIDALAPLVTMLAADELREPGVIRWAPDLIEAYARAGRDAKAHACLAVFSDQARATGRNWALAAAARCEGLLADDDFDGAFAHAIELERATPLPFELARSELCWGERLRRTRRRGAAREHLRHAMSIFERLGASGFAKRARDELQLAGEHPAPAREPALAALTPQELQIALHVARGATNREVAGALFLSVKTIEAHLHAIYSKLGLRRRAELAALVASVRDVTVDPASDLG